MKSFIFHNRLFSPVQGYLKGLEHATAHKYWFLSIRIAWTVVIVCFFQTGFAPAASITYVVFTTDVCWICGSDFKGSYKGTDYGIPFIVDRLTKHHMKGTFFVNSLCPDNLKDNMKINMEFLVQSGHDIQFHPHPDSIDLSRDNLTDYSKAEKTAIYRKGISELTNCGAPPPIAFRAGNYAIDWETLELLPDMHISIDSSIFPNDARSKVSLPLEKVNRFVKINGAYELPITLIRFLPLPRYWATTALDLDRTIWCEQKSALDQLASHNVPVATVFLHFHTFYTFDRAIKPFEPLRVTGVDLENIQEFDAMLNMLERDSRFKVVTIRDLWNIHRKDPNNLQGPAIIPYTGIWMTYKRAWAHFLGHGIKNKIFALAPIMAAIILITLIGYRARCYRMT